MAVLFLAAIAKTGVAYALSWVGLLQQALIVCIDCTLGIRHTAVTVAYFKGVAVDIGLRACPLGKHSQTIRKNFFSRFNPRKNREKIRRSRKRNITWYNTPFDMRVKTILGKKFIQSQHPYLSLLPVGLVKITVQIVRVLMFPVAALVIKSFSLLSSIENLIA